MTAKKLIVVLKGAPDDTRVITRGYEDGYDDVTGAVMAGIDLDVYPNEYYGHHELSDGPGSTTAVVLQTNRRQ